jgi:hypothetical protein
VLDNLLSVKRNAWVLDPNSQVISTMEYDGLGRKKAMNDPDMGRWEYGYDSVGNLTSQKDALYLSNPATYAGHLLLVDYDVMNRPTTKYYGQAHKNGNLGDVRFYYDNALGDGDPNTASKRGWLGQTIVTGGGATLLDLKITYENNGNVKTVSQNAIGTNGPTFTNSFTYDQKDRLRSAQSTGTNGSASL